MCNSSLINLKSEERRRKKEKKKEQKEGETRGMIRPTSMPAPEAALMS